MTDTSYVITGHIVEEEIELTLEELCQACSVDDTWLLSLVDEGILEPQQSGTELHFSGICIQRVRTVQRLQQDLDVNLAGAALALELMEEIDELKARMAALDPGIEDL